MSEISECRISILFSKIYIPLIELDKFVIFINYSNNQFKLNYPQTQPFIMQYYNPFTSPKSTITLTILQQSGKKLKKIAKGEINIYKKYFYANKLSFEKWVYLSLYRNRKQIPLKKNTSDILNTELNVGQIYVIAKLLDPIPSNSNDKQSFNAFNENSRLKNSLNKTSQEKDKLSSNKSERLKSIVEENNAFLKKLKMGDINNQKNTKDEDNISEVSMSNIGTKEDECELGLNFEYIFIGALPFYEKIKEIPIREQMTNNIKEQRKIYTKLIDEIKAIDEKYDERIKSLEKLNQEIKDKAKKYYNLYITEKEKFQKERKAYQLNKKKLTVDVKINNKANKIIREEIKKELGNFDMKISKLLAYSNDDNNIMIDILNTLKYYNKNISQGIDNTQRERLNELLSKRTNLFIKDPNMIGNGNDYLSEKLQNETEKIVAIIEKIVNQKFNEKIIPQIQIDQIDTFTYKFNNLVVTFQFNEKDPSKLKCTTGEDFEKWLIANFAQKGK